MKRQKTNSGSSKIGSNRAFVSRLTGCKAAKIAVFIFVLSLFTVVTADGGTEKYEAKWDSVEQYQIPEWFKDAKFGIFFRWGPYSVGAMGFSWYPRHMYREGHFINEYHKEHFGDPAEFGYKDFIPMLKAEKWEPDAWAELFKEAGARYVIPVACHHDGFAMYNSHHTRWNAVNMGPKRDVIGEISSAVRRKGLKCGVSSHYAWNWRYYDYAYDGSHPEIEAKYDINSGKYYGLYGFSRHKTSDKASEAFKTHWLERCKDIIDQYQPDLLYFDFGWQSFGDYRTKLAAYYYNKALEWDKGVGVTYKKQHMSLGTGILDFERGGPGDMILPMSWQTCTSVSTKSWQFRHGDEFKTPVWLITQLCDNVSKNGNVLLNIGPRPDGTIPPELTRLLKAIGAWLKINGEAIYETRPWRTFGEGPSIKEAGYTRDKVFKPYTAGDIRFTRKGNALYAILLGWPDDNEITIKSVR